MKLKKAISKIHLWLGLVSGLVVFFTCISGALMVFEQEIKYLSGSSSDEKVVEESINLELVNPSTVIDQVVKKFGEGIQSYYYTTGKTNNHVLVGWVSHEGSKDRNIASGYHEICHHPYTGEILLTQSWDESVWGWLFNFHTSLFLPKGVGHQVVGWSTIVFILLMVTGIVLWFPKRIRNIKQRLTIKWKAKFKRVNYDLHNVLGFYMSFVTIIIALTGLVWSFDWVTDAVYLVTTGEIQEHHVRPVSNYRESPEKQSKSLLFSQVDSLLKYTKKKYPDVYRYSVSYPVYETDVIKMQILYEDGHLYEKRDEYFYDRYTGDIVAEYIWSEHSLPQRIFKLNYFIHLGLIGGLSTKILAFLASIIGASLPVTGFVLWWGRRNKLRN